MKFSIVIPTHNRPLWLREALESVIAQDHTDWECIVVDDAGDVPMSEPVDDRIRCISSRRRLGPAGARNLGAAEARGDALVFLDDDDWWLPRRLTLAALGLQRAPVAVSWVGPRGRDLSGDVRHVILDSTTPHLNGVAVRSDVFVDFDDSYMACEDVEWWLRTAHRAQVVTIPEQVAVFRRHDGPRPLHGVQARIAASQRLLHDHAHYFADHPRAAAFRHYRIGCLRAQAGDQQEALRSFQRSLRIRPSLRAGRRLAAQMGGR